MDAVGQNVPRYTAKVSRRCVRFWWQPLTLLALLFFLWSQLPMTAVLFETRRIPGASRARAAYVVLDAAYAAQAFRKSVAVWTSGVIGMKQPQDTELGSIDFGHAVFPPEYLEQGSRYPGVWHPASVRALAVPLPDVRALSSSSGLDSTPMLSPLHGVQIRPDAVLRRALFAVPTFDETPPERSGHCRFYVETGSDGVVDHVLLMTARTPGAAFLEHALMKGRAKGATRGFVDADWCFAK